MNLIKLLLVLGAAGFVYQKWIAPGSAGSASPMSASAPAEAAPAVSRNGFVALPAAADMAGLPAVLVFAPQNCPREAGQRADSLVADLGRSGIPVSRSDHLSLSLDGGNPAAVERLSAVMNGEIPIVFVNGRAKANPTPMEVVAEYRDGGR